MINLRIALEELLGGFHERTYFEDAPKNTPFPYVVYTFPNSFTSENLETFVLDVDIWDNKEVTTELETLSSYIWKELDRYHHYDENVQFSIYRSNRLPLDDDDPTIKRRKLIFELKNYD